MRGHFVRMEGSRARAALRGELLAGIAKAPGESAAAGLRQVGIERKGRAGQLGFDMRQADAGAVRHRRSEFRAELSEPGIIAIVGAGRWAGGTAENAAEEEGEFHREGGFRRHFT